MTHYAQMFSIDRLQLSANIGYYDSERAKKQAVEIDIKLYFAAPPECASTDRGPFIDYAILIEAMRDYIASRQFHLIEYLASELFTLVRGVLTQHCAEEIKLWLRLTKAAPPIEGLTGGASYALSDLPAGATFLSGG